MIRCPNGHTTVTVVTKRTDRGHDAIVDQWKYFCSTCDRQFDVNNKFKPRPNEAACVFCRFRPAQWDTNVVVNERAYHIVEDASCSHVKAV